MPSQLTNIRSMQAPNDQSLKIQDPSHGYQQGGYPPSVPSSIQPTASYNFFPHGHPTGAAKKTNASWKTYASASHHCSLRQSTVCKCTLEYSCYLKSLTLTVKRSPHVPLMELLLPPPLTWCGHINQSIPNPPGSYGPRPYKCSTQFHQPWTPFNSHWANGYLTPPDMQLAQTGLHAPPPSCYTTTWYTTGPSTGSCINVTDMHCTTPTKRSPMTQRGCRWCKEVANDAKPSPTMQRGWWQHEEVEDDDEVVNHDDE